NSHAAACARATCEYVPAGLDRPLWLLILMRDVMTDFLVITIFDYYMLLTRPAGGQSGAHPRRMIRPGTAAARSNAWKRDCVRRPSIAPVHIRRRGRGPGIRPLSTCTNSRCVLFPAPGTRSFVPRHSPADR